MRQNCTRDSHLKSQWQIYIQMNKSDSFSQICYVAWVFQIIIIKKRKEKKVEKKKYSAICKRNIPSVST